MIGLGVKAWVNRTPSFANASKAGVAHIRVPVAVNVVGSKRIDRDKEDVRRERLRGYGGCSAEGNQYRQSD